METNSETQEKVGAGVGGVAGTAAGIGGGVVAVSAAGTTAGLSGAGITSGLAAIGGTAIGGIAVIAAGTVLLAAGGAWGGYKLVQWWKGKNNDPGPKQTMKMSHDEFRRMCDAVEGYIALGLVDEALNILEDLPPNLKITREVIALHIGILLKSKDYLKASYLAETLSMSEPENVDRMLDVARYRYQAGEFKDALAWLVSVERKCLGDADFHYLSAQCHAAIGDLEQARRSLQKVSALSETLRMRALDDPAFEAIYGAEPTLE